MSLAHSCTARTRDWEPLARSIRSSSHCPYFLIMTWPVVALARPPLCVTLGGTPALNRPATHLESLDGKTARRGSHPRRRNPRSRAEKQKLRAQSEPVTYAEVHGGTVSVRWTVVLDRVAYAHVRMRRVGGAQPREFHRLARPLLTR